LIIMGNRKTAGAQLLMQGLIAAADSAVPVAQCVTAAKSFALDSAHGVPCVHVRAVCVLSEAQLVLDM
jgi:hypothetical protein